MDDDKNRLLATIQAIIPAQRLLSEEFQQLNAFVRALKDDQPCVEGDAVAAAAESPTA